MTLSDLPLELSIALLGIFSALIFISAYIFYRRKKAKSKVVESSSEGEKPPILPPHEDGQNDVKEIQNLGRSGWLDRLNLGLKKTRDDLRQKVMALLPSKKFSEEFLEDLHEVLFRSDIGVSTSDILVNAVRNKYPKGSELSWEKIRDILRAQCLELLTPSLSAMPLVERKPNVILIIGVNGVGKTTTTGKLAASLLAKEKSVLLCAADTYRAAAIDQLKIWGERLNCSVIAHQQGSDPAAVAYDGVKAAIARGSDYLLVDTAGRLHNKQDLMAELSKIKRVLGKDCPEAPHEVWLVLDATTGQNAVTQVKAFNEIAKITGLIFTKLDGTAKGGVLLGISEQFKLPIRYIGVGEKAPDLREFSPEDYVDSLFVAENSETQKKG